MNEVAIWDRVEPIDVLDEAIKSGSNWDLVLSQIPSLFGYSDKATYLGFRAVGLTVEQALNCLGLGWADYKKWAEETPELVEFEKERLYDLQSKVGADIIRMGFLRNMTMFLFKDQKVIREAMVDIDSMSQRDFEYFKATRRFYSTHDLLALEKAVNPEAHRQQTIVLSFGDNSFEMLDNPEGRDQVKVIEAGDDN